MKTYNKIFNAFNKLIQTKSFDDITVLEICQKANVSTSSFYRHYKDKYDVMNDNYKRILDQYINSKQNHNYEDVFINLFTMSKELHYLKNAFDCLNQREKKVIQERYYQGYSQCEIADELFVSQAQISRIEKKALEKLHKKLV